MVAYCIVSAAKEAVACAVCVGGGLVILIGNVSCLYVLKLYCA